ncbi:hypothetical protein BHM03_00014651 [Ensete ventricosum]|nr:hypothetical protein BHM03_00014651 [Ensete ventricosum]
MVADGDDENRKTSQEQMKPLLASPHCSRSNNGTENDLLGAEPTEPNDADVDNEDEEGKEDAHVLAASLAGLASSSVAVMSFDGKRMEDSFFGRTPTTQRKVQWSERATAKIVEDGSMRSSPAQQLCRFTPSSDVASLQLYRRLEDTYGFGLTVRCLASATVHTFCC